MPPDRHDVALFETLTDVGQKNPSQIAFIDGNQNVTYAELMSLVETRAHRLAEAGLGTGDRVALVAENSWLYIATALAIWRAGGVLVTIYPSSAHADLAYTISAADPVLIVVDQRTAQSVTRAAPQQVPVVNLDEDFLVTQVHSGAAPNPTGLRAPLFLVCFTSGTTSRPKAIMLSAEAVLNVAETYAEVWHINADDRTLVALPMAWLFGLVTTALATLIRAGTVVVLRRAKPELLIQAIDQHHTTLFAGVTTMFAKAVDYLAGTDKPTDFSSLRLCVSGGEPRNEAAFDRWTAATGRPVFDTFCASECAPLVTYDPEEDSAPIRGSAGKLVPRSHLRVVDGDGKDVAPGEVGEALANGPGLFLGYWKDPDQTAAALTADGWYRQKDLVRVDNDGYVYVVGRLSDMIIRGGNNISPAEVERVLREFPAVRDAAVVGLPDDVYGQRVVAALVMAPGSQDDLDALAAHAREHLTSYKLPSEYIKVERLPQSATTGKVDRRQIAETLSQSGDARAWQL